MQLVLHMSGSYINLRFWHWLMPSNLLKKISSWNLFDELQDAVDPRVGDYELPEAIECMAVDTIELQEQG